VASVITIHSSTLLIEDNGEYRLCMHMSVMPKNRGRTRGLAQLFIPCLIGMKRYMPAKVDGVDREATACRRCDVGC
jgi:hypothetical protein